MPRQTSSLLNRMARSASSTRKARSLSAFQSLRELKKSVILKAEEQASRVLVSSTPEGTLSLPLKISINVWIPFMRVCLPSRFPANLAAEGSNHLIWSIWIFLGCSASSIRPAASSSSRALPKQVPLTVAWQGSLWMGSASCPLRKTIGRATRQPVIPIVVEVPQKTRYQPATLASSTARVSLRLRSRESGATSMGREHLLLNPSTLTHSRSRIL